LEISANGLIRSYLLFTTPFCSSCPPVKAFVSSLPLEGAMIDATDSEGSQKAESFGVMSVPTIIFLDENKNEVGRANSVSSIRSLLSED
jgi:glutaredoxin